MKKSRTNGTRLVSVPLQPTRGITINLNTVFGALASLFGALVLWMVTSGLQTGKENNKALTVIQTTLPNIDKGLTTVQADLKDASSKMVTRSEADNKQQRTEAAIKEVKDDVKEVKAEQTRVNNELMRRPPLPP
jgi:hypothetical protein